MCTLRPAKKLGRTFECESGVKETQIRQDAALPHRRSEEFPFIVKQFIPPAQGRWEFFPSLPLMGGRSREKKDVKPTTTVISLTN